MVRYLLLSNGSAQSLRHHASASAASSIRRKFSSYDSDLSTLSASSHMSGAATSGPFIGSLATAHQRSASASDITTASLRESGPVARALCKNCSYVFLCAYSPSGPEFCSMDCRTSFDLHTSEEETTCQPQQQQQQHYHSSGQQQPCIWDEPPSSYVVEVDHRGHHYGGGASSSGEGRGGRDQCYYQVSADRVNPPAHQQPQHGGEYGGAGSGGAVGSGGVWSDKTAHPHHVAATRGNYYYHSSRGSSSSSSEEPHHQPPPVIMSSSCERESLRQAATAGIHWRPQQA